MGDPRKIHTKFKKPRHPWQASRMAEEDKLLKEYGLVSKFEVWKMAAVLKGWQKQARSIVLTSADRRPQAEKVLITKLQGLGILGPKAKLYDVLALSLHDVLEKRLQTQVYKLGLAASSAQSRQFIVHNKVLVDGRLVNSPAYLVKKDQKISLIPGFKSIIAKIPKVQEVAK